MNARERFNETLLFGKPDKIPFQPGHPRESTLKTWHAQGLPENADYYEQVCTETGIDPELPKIPYADPGVSFKMMPEYEEKVLEHKHGHYIVRDWMGAIVEISDQFDATYLRTARDFVTRRWIKCPVETRGDWEEMKKRYDPATSGRFPADFEDRCRLLRNRDYVVDLPINGPFWQLREWLGFEGLCMLLIDDPEWIREMISFWSDFISLTLKPLITMVELDSVHISEDMAYKSHPMIGPDMTREFLLPVYQRWTREIKASGCQIVSMDSDGYIEDLIPVWIEGGINACDPLEVAAGCDIRAFRKKFGKNMAYRGGVDKRCMAKAGDEIRWEIERIKPVILDGGYIPGCD
ncbi:MAG: hypothetical protein A2350_01215, partial [Candidatus Raymondbacteria bacterium RifOxyB12_full_50_8]